MTRLNTKTLSALPATVRRPAYDRARLTPGIVHLGLGAFARARTEGDKFFDLLVEQSTEPPELVVFGSGSKLRFAPPALLRGLMARRIGVETMDTQAACRTYNILASEGRNVVAALILEV